MISVVAIAREADTAACETALLESALVSLDDRDVEDLLDVGVEVAAEEALELELERALAGDLLQSVFTSALACEAIQESLPAATVPDLRDGSLEASDCQPSTSANSSSPAGASPTRMKADAPDCRAARTISCSAVRSEALAVACDVAAAAREALAETAEFGGADGSEPPGTELVAGNAALAIPALKVAVAEPVHGLVGANAEEADDSQAMPFELSETQRGVATEASATECCGGQPTQLELERQVLIEAFLKNNGYSSVSAPKRTLLKTKYPIHTAAKQGNPALVRMLLELGADPSQKTSRGWTPAQIAKHRDRRGSHSAVLRILGGA
mmetsp:Transcript_53113/g.119725  ORF Transcript_53113/g.119725 Transcript_53113/m.119725 type:complete len:327 (+) Transcript_53113:37-1017(+)|eukprot:CAMPEP_0197908734 /NCGR_PEP_ID=MMETSP1439-20131203/67361_1 /TAXON_ID=66791 /ORGANISM="Gonyaulax spinifera, Strain CCMP409" /LENGTH=326 /DNA_ID=CAMNT_0043530241 /DNA_START=37 /DNA_END=1017 /DNA_ORIENTATION=+